MYAIISSGLSILPERTQQHYMLVKYHPEDCDKSTQAGCFILQDEFADEPGSVFEVDFYHANQLLPLTDDAVINKVRNRT